MKRTAGLIVPGAFVALVSAGCAGRNDPLLPNQPPEVELFAQRMSRPTTGSFAYQLRWVGHDPDGRIDHYLYAVCSPAADPRAVAWTSTTEREHALSFPARVAAPALASITVIEPSVFTVQAVDGLGARSAPAQIAFFEGPLAPRVEITSPRPNHLGHLEAAPSFCVEWAGTAFDDDSSAARVAEYKYGLLTSTTAVDVATALQYPDSVRRYYAARDWEGWVSVRGRVTSKVLRGLSPGQDYVFVITCFDEDGNYDPVFSFDKNMLLVRVTSAEELLPRINGAPPGEYKLEIPAGEPTTFNWYATASPGRQITGYRWALDLAEPDGSDAGDDDSDHEDRDRNQSGGDREEGDRHRGGKPGIGHWTPWSLSTTSATVGPFAGGEIHHFYIAAREGTGCGDEAVGVSTINLATVRTTYGPKVLIVDDTRLLPDRVNSGTTCAAAVNQPIGNWPTAAELDTFLYAVGGMPWRCYPSGIFSTAGIFSGYDFDTLGTRGGMANLTVPLSTLARYGHVIWITDARGARDARPGTDPTDPETALRYMNAVNTANTLATYVRQGGQLWLAGGGTATAATINFNKTNNDDTGLTFSHGNGGLVPGRFVYDQVHWRSEFKQLVTGGRIRRYLGRFESTPGLYGALPVEIQLKSPATDPFPPNRAGQSQLVFYQTAFDVEFLSAPNEIREDLDPGPNRNIQSALDTLYKVMVPGLPPGPGPQQSAVMTIYHGVENGQVILTGFNLWSFRRADCVALVDFVLQRLWGMYPSRAVVAPSSALRARQRVLGALRRNSRGAWRVTARKNGPPQSPAETSAPNSTTASMLVRPSRSQ